MPTQEVENNLLERFLESEHPIGIDHDLELLDGIRIVLPMAPYEPSTRNHVAYRRLP